MKPIQYSVTLRPNPQKPEEAKKAYATIQLTGNVDINELAAHIIDHGSVFSKGTIVGVLTDLVICTKELIRQGYKVSFGDLGSFEPSLSSTGAKTKDEFTDANIKEIRVNFNIGDGLLNLRRNATLQRTSTRAAQAAALKAENEGKTVADWTPEVEEGDEP
jgi:predicted histone-like DNA-binding protein